MPEGIVTAIPLREAGFGMFGFLALPNPRRCSRGVLVVARCRVHDLGILFGLAASAMVYITLDELVPEVYAHGEGHGATLGIAFGVICSTAVDGSDLGSQART